MGFQRNMYQEVTHWPVAGSDGYGGFNFGTVALLEARWEDRAELFINENLEEVRSRAVAYLDTSVNEGDYLALGDLTTTSDPTSISGTHRVRGVTSVTDLRALQTLHKVYL